MEGKGFEPTLDALFGERGFFPEAASNSMYNSGAYKVPKVLQGILDRLAPDGNRMKRQVTGYHHNIVMHIRYTIKLRVMSTNCHSL